jgi:hypothetical protein
MNTNLNLLDNVVRFTSNHPVVVSMGLALLCAVCLTLVILAFRQGREIYFWPPKIGSRPSAADREENKTRVVSDAPAKKTVKPAIQPHEQAATAQLPANGRAITGNDTRESIAKRSLFDIIAPTCILDSKHERMLDWNPAFELVFPTNGFRRFDHVDKWIDCLANAGEMKERIKSLFAVTHGLPTIDSKAIVYTSSRFGRIEFTTCFSQVIFPASGKQAGWVLNFDLDAVEKRKEMLAELQQTIQEHQHWKLYANSYDPILRACFKNGQFILTRAA